MRSKLGTTRTRRSSDARADEIRATGRRVPLAFRAKLINKREPGASARRSAEIPIAQHAFRYNYSRHDPTACAQPGALWGDRMFTAWMNFAADTLRLCQETQEVMGLRLV